MVSKFSERCSFFKKLRIYRHSISRVASILEHGFKIDARKNIRDLNSKEKGIYVSRLIWDAIAIPLSFGEDLEDYHALFSFEIEHVLGKHRVEIDHGAIDGQGAVWKIGTNIAVEEINCEIVVYNKEGEVFSIRENKLERIKI